MCKQASIKTLITNGSFKAGDEKLLDAFDEKRLEEMVITSNQAKADRAVAEAVLAGKTVAPTIPTPPAAPITSNAAPTAPMTDEQYLAMAPPNVASAINEALQWQSQQKQLLTNQLTAHVADPNVRKALTDSLILKSLAELRQLQLLVPASQPSAHQQPQRVSFFGQPGIPSVHQNQKIDENEILDTPRINWHELATSAN